MSRESAFGRRLEPVPEKTDQTDGRLILTTVAVLLGAVPLLLVDWYIVAALWPQCSSYEGGNITDCGGGLSEEQATGVAGLIALAILAVQVWLIVLASRRFLSDRRTRRRHHG
ncbi:hypothetical protein ABZT47_34285 [Sphaerisporangium sp. NPDC005289]|uniref:hypothetical protein n=1 Tax=Sphaerisporangium sp. NPDC005289 TaxID=3155247 RepID=UPI0033B9A543